MEIINEAKFRGYRIGSEIICEGCAQEDEVECLPLFTLVLSKKRLLTNSGKNISAIDAEESVNGPGNPGGVAPSRNSGHYIRR